jgi:hypothetical protein
MIAGFGVMPNRSLTGALRARLRAEPLAVRE